jgi:hypothetical protein
MRSALLASLALLLIGCRIEKVRSGDSSSPGAEPGPGIQACGISPESRVSEDGLGVLRIGTTLDAVRASCALIGEPSGPAGGPTIARIDLGRDTAEVEFANGKLRRITLYHQAYRTADSLGVGTHVSRLMNMRGAVGLTERNRLYAVAPAYCGLRFMLVEPAPRPPSAQSGTAALRRLSGETRARELDIVGCAVRR